MSVVRLAFSNADSVVERHALIACRECHNKTFKLRYEGDARFPLLQCAACEAHIGKIGWVHDAAE